jgi:hypothetical protein
MGSVIIIQEWTPGKSISKKSFPTKGAILAQSLRWTFSKQRAACDGISKIVKLVLNTLNVTLIVAAWQFYFEEDSRTHSWNIMKVDQKDYLLDITSDIISGQKYILWLFHDHQWKRNIPVYIKKAHQLSRQVPNQ